MPKTNKYDMKDYLAFGLVFLVLTLVFWAFTFGSFSPAASGKARHSLLDHNTWNYFLPQYQYCFERLRHGEIPLWNPYQACGVPALASLQPGVFYPPNWLYCFVDVTTGLKWLSIFHLVWTGLWMALLYRKFFPDSNRLAPFIASTGFVFSGFLPHQVWWSGNLYAASWLPCLIFFGERLVKKPSWSSTVALALAVALAFLAGFTQFTVYLYLLLCGFIVFRVLQTYAVPTCFRKMLIVLSLSASSAALAILIISPQLLPTMELVSLSQRGAGALWNAEASQFGGPEPYSFRNLLLGLFCFFPYGNYISFFMLLGVVMSSLDKKNRVLVVFIALSGLLSLLLSLGTNTFVYPFYFDHIPTGNWFSTPSRWRLITAFCVCMIGARGIELLLESYPREMYKKLWYHISPVKLLLLVGLALIMAGYIYSGAYSRFSLDQITGLFRPPFFPPLQFAALCIAIFLAYRIMRSSTVVMILIILAMFLEAACANRYQEPFPSRNNSPYSPDGIEFLKQNVGLQRVHLENNWDEARVFPEKAASLFKFYATTDWEPMSLYLYGRYAYTMSSRGNLRALAMPALNCGHYQLARTRSLFSMFNLFSVKYIVISDGAPDVFSAPQEEPFLWSPVFPRIEFPLVARFGDTKIYENPSPVPRALFSSNFIYSNDEIHSLLLLLQPAFDPLKNPIVDSVPQIMETSAPGADAKDDVHIDFMEEERMHCRVNAGNNGILWTTDAYYPGWKVKVDGNEARLLRVNYLFRGVAIPKGAHDIEFYYECRPLMIGFFLFLFALLIIPLGFVIQRLLRRARFAQSY